MLASQWVWQRTKSVIIPAEEQSAGCVVGYFYRVEFHSTRRFFSDSNYLFLKKSKKVRDEKWKKKVLFYPFGCGFIFRENFSH